MLLLRRKAGQSLGHLRSCYSTSHRKSNSDNHHSEHGNKGHHHTGATAESLGTQFYVALAIIPFSIATYTFSQPDADGKLPAITAFINSYSDWKDTWATRNTLHTQMVEQAAFDRNLFFSTLGTQHIDLRFPEVFNTGSPFNVAAGQGPRNLDVLVAHYRKQNADEEGRKLCVLRSKSGDQEA